jgi:hypothetical protein
LSAHAGRVADDDDSWESGSEGDLASEVASTYGCQLHGLKRALNDPNSSLHAEMKEDGGMTNRTDRTDATGTAGIDLTDYVESQFRSLAQQDNALFESCCQLLNPQQLQAVQACI